MVGKWMAAEMKQAGRPFKKKSKGGIGYSFTARNPSVILQDFFIILQDFFK